jgi:hypothetical protein
LPGLAESAQEGNEFESEKRYNRNEKTAMMITVDPVTRIKVLKEREDLWIQNLETSNFGEEH